MRARTLAFAVLGGLLALGLFSCGSSGRPTRPGEPTPPAPVSGVSMPARAAGLDNFRAEMRKFKA